MSRCIVKDALASGKLHPDQREWAESLCSRDRESLVVYLRLTPVKSSHKPTLFRYSTCGVCREEEVPCFSVLSSWHHGGHCVSGQLMFCVRCLTTGRWNNT